MVSELFLDVSDTGNTKTLRINDSSHYNPKIEVECGLLEVTPPGCLEAVNFNVSKAFSIVLNSSNLKLAKVRVYRDLSPLPDGIYAFKYSIKPNSQAWVEYDHLRASILMENYYTKLCNVKLKPYPNSTEVKEELKKLREIFSYIQAAKAEVEFKGNRLRGLELYNYAKQLLNITCTTC